MRSGAAAAVLAVLALGAGCAPTVWPSDGDRATFCTDMTGIQLSESGVDQLIREHGTPANLPFQARRYLIHLDHGREQVPGDRQVLDDYVADHC